MSCVDLRQLQMSTGRIVNTNIITWGFSGSVRGACRHQTTYRNKASKLREERLCFHLIVCTCQKRNAFERSETTLSETCQQKNTRAMRFFFNFTRAGRHAGNNHFPLSAREPEVGQPIPLESAPALGAAKTPLQNKILQEIRWARIQGKRDSTATPRWWSARRRWHTVV